MCLCACVCVQAAALKHGGDGVSVSVRPSPKKAKGSPPLLDLARLTDCPWSNHVRGGTRGSACVPAKPGTPCSSPKNLPVRLLKAAPHTRERQWPPYPPPPPPQWVTADRHPVNRSQFLGSLPRLRLARLLFHDTVSAAAQLHWTPTHTPHH